MQEKSYKMPEAITFKTVNTVLRQLHQSLSNIHSDEWVVDLHAVQHFDSAGLALLIEAKRMASNNNKILKVVGASNRLVALSKFCGVDVVLDD